MAWIFGRKKISTEAQTPQEEEISGKNKIYMMSDALKAFLFYGGIILIFILARYVPVALGSNFGWLGAIAGCLLIPIIIFIFIYSLWAPADITWTFVNENQNKAVYYFGKFKGILFNSKDKILVGNKVLILANLTYQEIKALERQGLIKLCYGDKSCNINFSKGTEWNGEMPNDKGDSIKGVIYIEIIESWWRKIFGGLHFIGPWPFYKIKTYILPEHIQIEGTQEKPHVPEFVHSVSSVEIAYGIPLNQIIDLELLPIEGELVVMATMVDMPKFIIQTPNALVQMLGLIHSDFSHYARSRNLKDINIKTIKDKEGRPDEALGEDAETGSDFWKELKKKGILEEIEKKYGLVISAIKAVTPFRSPKYEEKMLEVYFAGIDGDANAARSEGDAKATQKTYEVVKIIFESLKPSTGGDKEKENQLWGWCLDVVRRKPYIDTRQAMDLWINGGQGGQFSSTTDAILGLTANHMVQQGKGGSSSNQSGDRRSDPKTSDYRKNQPSSKGSGDQMNKYIQMSKDPNSEYYGIHPDDIRDYEKAMRKANKNTGDSENKKPEPKLSDEQREALEEKGLLEDL